MHDDSCQLTHGNTKHVHEAVRAQHIHEGQLGKMHHVSCQLTHANTKYAGANPQRRDSTLPACLLPPRAPARGVPRRTCVEIRSATALTSRTSLIRPKAAFTPATNSSIPSSSHTARSSPVQYERRRHTGLRSPLIEKNVAGHHQRAWSPVQACHTGTRPQHPRRKASSPPFPNLQLLPERLSQGPTSGVAWHGVAFQISFLTLACSTHGSQNWYSIPK
jgi:hypothetical protein